MPHRFVWLFFALLCFFLLVAVTEQLRAGGYFDSLVVLEVVIFALLVGGVAISISRTHTGRVVVLLLGLPSVVLWMLHLALTSDVVEFTRAMFAASFMSYAIVLILLEVFAARQVTSNILCASLCAYLLLGIVWALGYSMISTLDAAAFTHNVGTPEPAHMRVGTGRSAQAVYFSYATLTTLGYGDIVPTAPIARALACLEALIGQLYLAVLVARLVGLQIVYQMSGDGNEQKST